MMSKTALGAAVVLSAAGVSVDGAGFLTQPVVTPLWFVIAVAVVPTGEALRLARYWIRSYLPPSKKGRKGDTS